MFSRDLLPRNLSKDTRTASDFFTSHRNSAPLTPTTSQPPSEAQQTLFEWRGRCSNSAISPHGSPARSRAIGEERAVELVVGVLSAVRTSRSPEVTMYSLSTLSPAWKRASPGESSMTCVGVVIEGGRQEREVSVSRGRGCQQRGECVAIVGRRRALIHLPTPRDHLDESMQCVPRLRLVLTCTITVDTGRDRWVRGGDCRQGIAEEAQLEVGLGQLEHLGRSVGVGASE